MSTTDTRSRCKVPGCNNIATLRGAARERGVCQTHHYGDAASRVQADCTRETRPGAIPPGHQHCRRHPEPPRCYIDNPMTPEDLLIAANWNPDAADKIAEGQGESVVLIGRIAVIAAERYDRLKRESREGIAFA